MSAYSSVFLAPRTILNDKKARNIGYGQSHNLTFKVRLTLSVDHRAVGGEFGWDGRGEVPGFMAAGSVITV